MTRLLPRILPVVVTVLLIVLAVVALIFVWRHYQEDPWTRDGTVQADVAQVSPDVSGLVTQLRVHDNQFVRAGDVLFTVDRERFLAAQDQAAASVASSRASIVSARADVAKSAATYANSEREARRYLALGDLVSAEERDQHVSQAREDRAALLKSEASLGEQQASLQESLANLRKSDVDVRHSVVRAGVTGYVTGFSLRPGQYVSSGSSQFAVLDTTSFYVLAYLEETKLHRFTLGDQAEIDLLGDPRPLYGHVDSLSAGVTDRQREPSDKSLPNITPTFSWIRLAQRVPVRIVIDRVPVGVRLVAGRTATVHILPTAAPVVPRPLPESAVLTNTVPPHRQLPPPVGQPSNAPVP